MTYRWDENYVHERYEMLSLKVIHRRMRTGFEECKDIAIHVNDLIAGRYQVSCSYRLSPRGRLPPLGGQMERLDCPVTCAERAKPIATHRLLGIRQFMNTYG